MGDPAEFGDPDHVVEKYTGTADNGGVHSNSGIANHAYYLTVNGGQNAGCTATATRPATHTEDCDVSVPALGLDRAAQIYYAGFTSLPEYANFCDARNATVAVAGEERQGRRRRPGTPSVSTTAAPRAPRRRRRARATRTPSCRSSRRTPTATTVTAPGPTTTAAPASRSTSRCSTRRQDYDYLYVKDGNGQRAGDLHRHLLDAGSTRRASPRRPASVQLVTDPAVTGQGFTIDAVNPC